MKIANGTKWWILTPLICALVLFVLSMILSGFLQRIVFVFSLLFFLLSAVFLVFFRDPDRKIGSGIVAVADGKIQSIEHLTDDYVGTSVFISTFMNINNVHVNRMPIDGIIKKISHIPGSHLPAFTKDSKRNERIIYEVESKIGPVKIIQIAGTLARRIVPYVTEKDQLKKGDKLGIIRLGSRVDLYLPKQAIASLTIKQGKKIRAGVDRIAIIHD